MMCCKKVGKYFACILIERSMLCCYFLGGCMKKIFDEKRNKEDEIGLIVLSHGPLAISLYESAKMIYGDVENATALSLGYGDEISAYADEIEKAINFYSNNLQSCG